MFANYSDTSTSWSGQLQVATISSPRPSAGEGLGGEGDTSLLNQLPKLVSGCESENACENSSWVLAPHS
jgi:hypothetical protein